MYGEYIPGLLLAIPQEEEASVFNEAAQKRLNLKSSLEETSEDLLNQFDRDKQQREIDKFRDYKLKLSPLNTAKSIPLYSENENEYWMYLSSQFGNEEDEDGLLYFIIDLIKNIQGNTTFIM